jgi:hypothetical protein
MEWVKKGIIYKPSGFKKWALTHAHVPCVIHLKKKKYTQNYFFIKGRLWNM